MKGDIDHSSDNLLFENLIGYKELSEWLSISERTLQDWVYKREIPFLKLGKHVRFCPVEIRRWLKQQRRAYGHITMQK